MHQTGVPNDLVGERIKLGGYKGCYPCQSKDCEYVAQTRGVLCSHIRRVHLGITLGYCFCPEKCWWQARYWVEHMDKTHPEAHKFEVIPPGSKPIVSSTDADLFVSEETFMIPAPSSEPTTKTEVPDTTQEEEQPTKRGRFDEQDLQLIHMGADAILSDPPLGHGVTQPHPEILGIRYQKDQDEC